MKKNWPPTPPDLLVLEEFGRFRRLLNLHFTNALRPLGLGVKQAALLRFLAKRGKASLAELSRDTLTDPAAMTRLVKVLMGQGLVRQKDHPTDKRRWELALTFRGVELALKIESVVSDLASRSLRALPAAEKSGFSKTLKKLSESFLKEKNNLVPLSE